LENAPRGADRRDAAANEGEDGAKRSADRNLRAQQQGAGDTRGSAKAELEGEDSVKRSADRNLRIARQDAGEARGSAKAELEGEDGAKRSADRNLRTQQQDAGETRSFDELIAGEYKEDFDRRVQQIVRARLRETRAAQDRLNQFAPALQIVAGRYGLDFSDPAQADPAALLKALREDRSLYADEAAKKGVEVEKLMRQKRVERELQQARAFRARVEGEARIRQRYGQLRASADAFQKKEPGFSLAREMRNDTFARMVVTGFPLETAYHAAHYAELEEKRRAASDARMREVAQSASQKAANAVRLNGLRPSENGTGGAAAALSKIDISKLTRNDIRELTARAARGEVFPSNLFTG
jgi:hypothetical protein